MAVQECLAHFDTLGRGGEAYAVAVVLLWSARRGRAHSARPSWCLRKGSRHGRALRRPLPRL